MKKYNRLLIVVSMILVAFLLSWILPTTYISGDFVTQGRTQVGLLDLFADPVFTFYNFIYILIYLLVVSGFYAILKKVPSYRLLLDKIVKFGKNKKVLFFILIVFLLSSFVSLTGFVYESIIFIPFICAIVLMMGYDKVTCALTTIGSISIGVFGSTISKNIIGKMNSLLTVEYSELVLARIVMLVIGVALLVGFIFFYNRKGVKEDIENEVKNEFIPEKVSILKKGKLWPLAVILGVFTLIYLLASIDWTGVFNITFFDDVVIKLTDLNIGEFSVFGKILGTAFVPFGRFEIHNYLILIFITLLVIKIVYRVKFIDCLDEYVEGNKKSIPVILLILLSYTVLIIMNSTGTLLTILKPLLNLTDGLNTITLSISNFLGALFNSDFAFYEYHAFNASYVTTFINDSTLYGLCTLITQSMYGIAMFIAPTSVVMLYTLSSLKLSYFKWIKKIAYLVLALFAVAIIAFTILLRFFV